MGEKPEPADDGRATPTPAWTSPQAPGWTTPTPPQQSPPTAPPAWGGQPGWGHTGPWRPDVKPGVIPLRPLGVGEILDGAISTIRQHPTVMLGVSAVVGVLSAVLSGLASWLTLRDFEGLDPETATDDEVLDAIATSVAASGGGFFVLSLATLVATGVLTIAISKAVLGQSVALGEAWKAARPRILRLVGLWLLTSLIVVGVLLAGPIIGIIVAAAGAEGAGIAVGVIGLIGGTILAIYFYVRFSLAAPALMLEMQRIVASMRRSHRLVKGTWWRIFGILLLTLLLTVILSQIVQAPFGLLGYGTGYFVPTEDFSAPGLLDLTIAGIGGVVASAITLPFSAGVTTLLYVDQRMRREALDIELARTASTGSSSTGSSSTGSSSTGSSGTGSSGTAPSGGSTG